MTAPKILFYHDGRHPLIYMYEPPMQKEEYEQGVDELLGTPVEAIMFCLGDGRTVLHDTQVGELWGHNRKKWPHLIFRRAYQNARDLIGKGHDPLQLICDRARQYGKKVYPTLLVQQGRGPWAEDVRCSNFRFDNPQLEIGAGGDLPADYPGATCLDFKHRAVRDERFALIKETLEKYPVDGFELQMNYQTHYFHPEEVAAGRKIMTEWVRKVYRAVKRSGRRRELVIRIPYSMEGCYSVGMDIEAWLEEGIVDALVGQAFGGPELLDPTVDFRPLVSAATKSGCRVYAALQSHVDSDRVAEGTIEMIRAAATNYWAQGVDGLYLAHWFGNWPYGADFYEKLRELPYPEVMAPRDKIYHVPTVTGRYPDPPTEPGMGMQLPVSLERGEKAKINISISDDLRRWGKVGRVHEVLLRIRVMGNTERDRLCFALNGRQLPDRLLRKINELYRMSAPRYRTGSGYWYAFSLDAKHWPRPGDNQLEIELLRRDAQALPDIFVRDVELDIKYLMGRNFHRGQDQDLGPAESVGI